MHLSRRTLVPRALLVGVFVALFSLTLVSCDTAGDPSADVTVVSYNLYLGTDIFDLVGTSQQEIPFVAHRMFQEVHATDFPTRAYRIADLIAAHNPHLIGLQEVTLYRTQTPSAIMQGQAPNAQDVAYDFLEILLVELNARGLNYREVSTVANADVTMPASGDGQNFYDIRFTDRDVILARNDVSVTAAAEYTFQATATIPVGGQNIPFLRGMNHVLATVNGVSFTFANVHLEVGGQAVVQEAQALEMIQQLQPRPTPIILVGDLNSRADGTSTATYAMVTGQQGGFTDVFSQMGTAQPTCCQDDDLRNPQSALHQRIDFILYRGAVTPLFSQTLGNVPADRINGLWPSDHAGLVATLRVTN
jgi:endonuclease/exonuclease/phosphatase family metal-dependent hydrolase